MRRIVFVAIVAAGIFGPAPHSEAAITIAAGAGDISSSGSGDNQTAALVPTDAQVITMGDNQYPDGCLDAFNTNYENSWGAFKSRTRPAIGNHDSHDTSCSVDGNGYFDYFNGVGSGTCFYSCRAGKRGEGWYSYNIGDWHFIALNSECNGTSYDFCDHTAQLSWLTNDLASNTKLCTLAYWHRPIVAPSSTHSDDEGHFANAYFGGDNVWQKLYDAGVDLVLQGHDHLYARYAPYNRAGNNTYAQGVRHFIVGTGGNGNYAVTETKPGQEFAIATLGIMKLTLNPTNYSWQFVNTSNTVLDSGSDYCHSAPRPDTDGDGWPDSDEATIGTNPNMRCGTNAWPADINNDGYSDGTEITILAGSFGKAAPPAPARRNVAPIPLDGFVDGTDITRLGGLLGMSC
jgi:acid phosphatase type 7